MREYRQSKGFFMFCEINLEITVKDIIGSHFHFVLSESVLISHISSHSVTKASDDFVFIISSSPDRCRWFLVYS